MRSKVSSLANIFRLYGSQGNHDSSNQLIEETLKYARKPEDRAHALRLRGRNRFIQRDFEGAYRDTVSALEAIGMSLPSKISILELDEAFDAVKTKLLSFGFDEILHLNRTGNHLTDLKISLLNDAANNAFWGAPQGMADYIGVQVSPTFRYRDRYSWQIE
jgi:hypothetical protein